MQGNVDRFSTAYIADSKTLLKNADALFSDIPECIKIILFYGISRAI